MCGDETDLIEGRPTGAVRVSFGYMSRRGDADRLLLMVRQCFVTAAPRAEEAAERLRSAQQRRSVAESAAAAGTGVASAAAAGDSKRPVAENGSQVDIPPQPEQTTANTAELVPSPAVPPPTAAVSNAHPDRSVRRPLTSSGGTPSASPGAAPGPRLSGLVVYPVKSCCGFPVRWWPLGPRGLLYDRHWMVVTSGGAALTQKRQPALCRVRPELCLNTGQLRLTADGEMGATNWGQSEPIDVGVWMSVGTCG